MTQPRWTDADMAELATLLWLLDDRGIAQRTHPITGIPARQYTVEARILTRTITAALAARSGDAAPRPAGSSRLREQVALAVYGSDERRGWVIDDDDFETVGEEVRETCRSVADAVLDVVRPTLSRLYLEGIRDAHRALLQMEAEVESAHDVWLATDASKRP